MTVTFWKLKDQVFSTQRIFIWKKEKLFYDTFDVITEKNETSFAIIHYLFQPIHYTNTRT